MASAVSGLFGSNTNTGQTSSSQNSSTQSANASALSNASNEQMFLQLLVSQMKNQDPTNPVDGTQFVSELSQFSQVEQLIAIRTDIEGAISNNTGNKTNTNAAGNPASGTPASGTTPGNATPSGTSGTNPTGTTN